MLTIPELLIMFKGIPAETIAAAVADERIIPGVSLRRDYKGGALNKEQMFYALTEEYNAATPEAMQRVKDCAQRKMDKLAAERAKKKSAVDKVSAAEALRQELLREWRDGKLGLPWASTHRLRVSRNPPLLAVEVPASLVWLHGPALMNALGCDRDPPPTYGWEFSKTLSLFLPVDKVRALSAFWLSLSLEDQERADH